MGFQIFRFTGCLIIQIWLIWRQIHNKRWLMLVPILAITVGLFSNAAVVLSNGGKMPVSGYYHPEMVGKAGDFDHTLLRPEHRLKCLADVHGPSWARYSVGDAFTFPAIPLMFL